MSQTQSLQLLQDFYITVWDTNFNVCGLIDDIVTLETTSYLNKQGTFQLTVPLTPNHIELLQVGNIITKSTFSLTENDNFVVEPWLITMRQIKINNDGVETLEVQGNNLLTWLNQRVLTTMYNTTDTIANLISTMVTNECITPVDSNRVIPNLVVVNLTSSNAKTTYITQSQYSSLLGALTNVASGNYTGFKILMNPYQQVYILEIFEGEDRSQHNTVGNEAVIFSSALNNIMSESYTHTNVNFNNTCYVYAQLNNGSTESNKLIIVGEENAGLNRFETSVNGADPTINGDEIQLTKGNYEEVMTALGEQTLALASITKNFDGKLNLNADLQYKKNFNLGDTVTVYNFDWGLYMNNVITSVTEQWSVNGIGIKLSFGYPLPTLLEKINQQF